MSDLNLSFEDFFPEDFFISGYFGEEYSQIIEQIIQVISSSPRSSGITFDDILEELGNYLPDKTVYLANQSLQYLKTDSFRLSDNRLFKLSSSINKIDIASEEKFLKDSKSKFAQEKPHYIS